MGHAKKVKSYELDLWELKVGAWSFESNAESKKVGSDHENVTVILKRVTLILIKRLNYTLKSYLIFESEQFDLKN